jgi:hypothetical protein
LAWSRISLVGRSAVVLVAGSALMSSAPMIWFQDGEEGSAHVLVLPVLRDDKAKRPGFASCASAGAPAAMDQGRATPDETHADQELRQHGEPGEWQHGEICLA